MLSFVNVCHVYVFETLHFKVNIVIVTDVCPEERLDALQAAILLLPDENREVLQCLLSFLADMALSAAENQVNCTLDNCLRGILRALISTRLCK